MPAQARTTARRSRTAAAPKAQIEVSKEVVVFLPTNDTDYKDRERGERERFKITLRGEKPSLIYVTRQERDSVNDDWTGSCDTFELSLLDLRAVVGALDDVE